MDDEEFAEVFDDLRLVFTHRTQRDFIDAIEAEIADRPPIQELLARRRGAPRYVAVTFDRRPNDAAFSYAYFDLLLVILDRLQGGRGIFKPVSQLRAMRWNSPRPGLLRLLRLFRRIDPRINYRRVLILPFPTPPVGTGIDGRIYRR